MALLVVNSIADLSFGGAFLWYLAKYIIYGVVAFCGILLGIRLRKNKNAKTEK